MSAAGTEIPALSASVSERLDEFAAELELDAALRPFDAQRWRTQGIPPAPTLQLEDVSAIPFLDGIAGVELYQHRARVRAGDGDLVAAVTEVTPGYESYCRRLGLGAPELLMPEPVTSPLAVAQACSHGDAFDRIAARAESTGALVIHPYMAIEPVWQLAHKVASETGADVTVIGPPPPVTWIANDKRLFSEVVRRTLGDRWLVDTEASADIDVLAAALVRIGKVCPVVGLKRTRCASAMGNRIYDSADVVRGGIEGAREIVRAFLRDTECADGEQVLAVAWEQTELSPSTQLWIPPHGCGPVRLDGIYEQLLTGDTKMFLGSRPSGLPVAVEHEIARGALAVGAALQYLGYSGRCSFDHLVVADGGEPFRVLFTECNGRWGGTSTPMSLVDRLVSSRRGGARPPYRAQDFVRDSLIGAEFPDVLARVGEALYDPQTERGTFIFYNVGPLVSSGKLDVIALGSSQEVAEAAMLEQLPQLLGTG